MTGYQLINARTYTGTTEQTIVDSYQKDLGQSKVMLGQTILDQQLRSSTAVESIATSILAGVSRSERFDEMVPGLFQDLL